jgi:SpoVK/Ycf46/Vps4 family AAA+-type ATPase
MQMLPFLHASHKSTASEEGQRSGRATVLLTGPERAGKAMEVQAAASALGLHVFEVDCRSLTASPMDEAECVTQLLEVVQQV